MTSCIVGNKIRAMGPDLLELFPFVLAILIAVAGGISQGGHALWKTGKMVKKTPCREKSGNLKFC